MAAKKRQHVKPQGQNSSSRARSRVFPFLRLPREVRDRIYDELLIARLKLEDQAKYDRITSATETPLGDYGRENAIDFFEQDLGLLPGIHVPNAGVRSIAANKNILLVNKQVYDEACDVLFGKNLFLIWPECERVRSFWRCASAGCIPRNRPCYVRPENAAKVKNLYIIINNPRTTEDPKLAQDLSRLRTNIQLMVDCLQQVGAKLQSLKIRYTSCFGGEIDAVREDLEGPVDPSLPERPVLLKDNTGRYHCVKRNEAQQLLFKHTNILDPLKALKGIAEDVRIRGDLPQVYMDQLVDVLAVKNPSAATRKKKQHEKEAASKRINKKPADIRDFARKMLEEKQDLSPSMKSLYQQLMRTSKKSPSVMAELCAPPTQEEFASFGRMADLPSRPASPDGPSPSNTATASATAGGIGFIAGKPVFGPVRPPADQP